MRLFAEPIPDLRPPVPRPRGDRDALAITHARGGRAHLGAGPATEAARR